jgi:2-dehydropantoate 2-reductase
MKYAVLGPGGIGGLLAGLLSRAGHDVVVVVRKGADQSYPDHVHVESPVYGTFDAGVRHMEHLAEHVDVLLVTCKATHLAAAIESAPAAQIGTPLVIPLLNGLDHIGVLRRAYGQDAVVPGMIRAESTRVAPGRIVHNGWHVVRVENGDPLTPQQPLQLSIDGPRADEVRAVAAELADAGLQSQLWDEGQVVWQKLAVLAPHALATTAVAGPIGAARANAEVLDHMRNGTLEIVAVAAAQGITLNRDRLMDAVERFPDAMRPSMLRDLEAGREPEIANIADPIIRQGQELGVPVTSMEWLRERAREQVAARQ